MRAIVFPKLKKSGYSVLKLLHILFNSFWLGGALGMILLLTLGLQPANAHGITKAVHILDLGVVVPSAFGSLVTGILFSTMTHWGFAKHRWIVAKYVINLIPVITGAFLQAPWLIQMVELSADINASTGFNASFLTLRTYFLSFVIFQLALLFLAAYLSVFKPTLKAKADKAPRRPAAAGA